MKTLNEYLKYKECGREGGSDSFPEQTKWYEELFNKSKFKNVITFQLKKPNKGLVSG